MMMTMITKYGNLTMKMEQMIRTWCKFTQRKNHYVRKNVHRYKKAVQKNISATIATIQLINRATLKDTFSFILVSSRSIANSVHKDSIRKVISRSIHVVFIKIQQSKINKNRTIETRICSLMSNVFVIKDALANKNK